MLNLTFIGVESRAQGGRYYFSIESSRIRAPGCCRLAFVQRVASGVRGSNPRHSDRIEDRIEGRIEPDGQTSRDLLNLH